MPALRGELSYWRACVSDPKPQLCTVLSFLPRWLKCSHLSHILWLHKMQQNNKLHCVLLGKTFLSHRLSKGDSRVKLVSQHVLWVLQWHLPRLRYYVARAHYKDNYHRKTQSQLRLQVQTTQSIESLSFYFRTLSSSKFRYFRISLWVHMRVQVCSCFVQAFLRMKNTRKTQLPRLSSHIKFHC